jgi:hypothetical protein
MTERTYNDPVLGRIRPWPFDEGGRAESAERAWLLSAAVAEEGSVLSDLEEFGGFGYQNLLPWNRRGRDRR